jgi:hypothetical protein
MQFAPQFSVRWFLLAMIGFSGLFSLGWIALNGHLWAAAVLVGIMALVITLLVHMVVFFPMLLISLGQWGVGRRNPVGVSPFLTKGVEGQDPFRPTVDPPPAADGEPGIVGAELIQASSRPPDTKES